MMSGSSNTNLNIFSFKLKQQVDLLEASKTNSLPGEKEEILIKTKDGELD